MLPSMTLSAPAAIALAKSPENLIPPSAMTGIPFFFMLETTSAIAVIWGTPTPVTILVVQMEPGPIPDQVFEATGGVPPELLAQLQNQMGMELPNL